jgi:hypothetical protein
VASGSGGNVAGFGFLLQWGATLADGCPALALKYHFADYDTTGQQEEKATESTLDVSVDGSTTSHDHVFAHDFDADTYVRLCSYPLDSDGNTLNCVTGVDEAQAGTNRETDLSAFSGCLSPQSGHVVGTGEANLSPYLDDQEAQLSVCGINADGTFNDGTGKVTAYDVVRVLDPEGDAIQIRVVNQGFIYGDTTCTRASDNVQIQCTDSGPGSVGEPLAASGDVVRIEFPGLAGTIGNSYGLLINLTDPNGSKLTNSYAIQVNSHDCGPAHP